MVFEEEIVPGVRGGRRGSDSDDLNEMEYAESFVTGYVPEETLKRVKEMVPDINLVAGQNDPETLRSLIKREVLKAGDSKYKYTMTDLEELQKFGFDAESLSSSARMINAVFVALEIPYFAAAYTSPKVVAEEHKQKARTTRKDGTVVEKGTYVIRKVADRVKIHKTEERWDASDYACKEGRNPSKKYVSVNGVKTLKTAVLPGSGKDPAGVTYEPWILKHDEPTIGVRKRMAKWLREIGGKDYPEILKVFDIGEDHVKRLEEKVGIRAEEVETGEEPENGEENT